MSELGNRLQRFIQEHCRSDPQKFVGSTVLRNKFEQHIGQQVTSLRHLMITLGYKFANRRVNGANLKCFLGLSCIDHSDLY